MQLPGSQSFLSRCKSQTNKYQPATAVEILLTSLTYTLTSPRQHQQSWMTAHGSQPAGNNPMIDDEDDDEDYAPDWLDELPLDPVAARAEAFWKGIALLVHIQDAELRREGLMMLGAIRRSFKTLPSGDLASIPGGKPN